MVLDERIGLFKGRHLDQEIIVLCVRWYLKYKLSSRDLVQMMSERGVALTLLPHVSHGRRLLKPTNAKCTGTLQVARCAVGRLGLRVVHAV
jgi:hypothetical protein